jgi:CRP-like cAMP-binding protein
MKEYLSILKKSPLFAGVEEGNIETILPCLQAVVKRYDKNQFIFEAEERVTTVGLILSGSVLVIKEDFWGNRDILSQLGPAELFAEAFSCAQVDRLPVSVVAAEKTDVLLVNYKKIITTCSTACSFHTLLIQNMMKILAQKSVTLMQKLEQMAKRTTREKLLAYLSAEAQKTGGSIFEIPFNRQELADYLSVDRSAMSSELGKMRDEGILTFDKNHFELKQ